MLTGKEFHKVRGVAGGGGGGAGAEGGELPRAPG